MEKVSTYSIERNPDTYKNVAGKIVALSIYNKEYPEEPIQMIEYIFAGVFPEYGYTGRREDVSLDIPIRYV